MISNHWILQNVSQIVIIILDWLFHVIELNDSNTKANKRFNNHSDFQVNTTLLTRQTFNYDGIYSWKCLSVNQLNCLVNDNTYYFITDFDIQCRFNLAL